MFWMHAWPVGPHSAFVKTKPSVCPRSRLVTRKVCLWRSGGEQLRLGTSGMGRTRHRPGLQALSPQEAPKNCLRGPRSRISARRFAAQLVRESAFWPP